MKALIADIRELIQVFTSFQIGRGIVEHEQQGTDRAEYGKALLKDLVDSLTNEFGRRFSRSNLQNMRKFYLSYSDRFPGKCQMSSGKSRFGKKARRRLAN
jgi:hypothetical protein